MVQYIFTPWRDRDELLVVRAQFYPEHCWRIGAARGGGRVGGGGYGSGSGRGMGSGLEKTPSSGTGASSSSSSWPSTSTSASTSTSSATRSGIRRGRESGSAYDGDDGNGDAGERRRAVARVSMWMQRGGCPHMVESTALLAAAILSDEGSGSGSGNGRLADGAERAARGYAVRAAYSAAFSRFVTGLLDSHQDKQRKMSMYDVAKAVGLPATFVELRHQATHEQLPSLTRLRAAARDALEWIWDYYWRHLAPSTAAAAADGQAAAVEDSGAGDGGASNEDGEVRALVRRYLAGEDDGGRLKEEIMGRFEEVDVLMALDSAAGTTRDSRVLRRAVALTREVLDWRGDPDRMQEDGKAEEDGAVKDVVRVRAEISKAWEEMELLEERIGEVEGKYGEQGAQGDVEMTEERPAWVLYEEDSWVPKPIGVV